MLCWAPQYNQLCKDPLSYFSKKYFGHPIDSIIMGLTFLAWANSIGDFVADTSLARIGKARTAVS